MRLNDAGVMIQAAWREIPSFYVGVGIDAFVVMPNHVHGIIILVGADPCVRPDTDDTHNADMDRVRADPCVRPDTDDTDDKHNADMDRVRADPRVRPDTDDTRNTAMDRVRADPRVRPDSEGQARGPAPTKALSLGDVVQRYKMLTTKRYADGVKRCGWPPFPRRLWQRNYYEHIIRSENELRHARIYIADNPTEWERDHENPLVIQ